jgi:tRNA(fMet)-specific endonuclease VapC
MAYLLDTDTIVYWMNDVPHVVRRIGAHDRRNLAASVISRAELNYGAYRSGHIDANIAAIRKLSQTIEFLPLSEHAQHLFGRIKAELHRDGNPLADSDLLIAATALAEDMTLVTNNTRHFARVPLLRLENWRDED